jgi:hypothetical protein
LFFCQSNDNFKKDGVIPSDQRGSQEGDVMAVTVLLCYAREDERMAQQLKKHLSLLERNKSIAIWDYGDIDPGTERDKEIKSRLTKAQITLLLISASFLSSDYCYESEMQQAIEGHERKTARVIPVILRPCYWNGPPLDKLQPLPDGARPIVARGRDPNNGFTNVAQSLARIVEQLNSHNLPEPLAERRTFMVHLDKLVEAVKAQMQPEPRAIATAYTLEQVNVYTPVEVTLADLIAGWKILSQPKNKAGEEIAIAQRRVTCGELASIASQFTTEVGSLDQAIKTWDVWQKAFKNRDDPRQMAMARTFARELVELQEAARAQE